MKKAACLIIPLLFLLPASLSAGAANETVTLAAPANITSSVVLNGQLLLIAGGFPFAYTPGEPALQALRLTDKGAQLTADTKVLGQAVRLFTSQGSLYAVDVGENAAIYPIAVSAQADDFVVGAGRAIDAAPLLDAHGFAHMFEQIFSFEGRLYFLYRSYQGDNVTATLLSYDIESGGAATLHRAEDVWALCPYTDGMLLALVMNYAQQWDRNTNRITPFLLRTYDPKTSAWADYAPSGVVFDMRSPGILRDADSGDIYIKSGTSIYLHQAPGKAVPMIPLPSEMADAEPGQSSLHLLPGGTFALISGRDISLHGGSAGQALRQLNILGGYSMARTYQRTVDDIKDVMVTFLNQRIYASALELAQALVSGDEHIDLIVLRSNYIDIQQIMDKGYAADLSDAPALCDYVDALYPSMQQAGSMNGRLYMVPVMTDSKSTLSYNADVLRRMKGLELPQTYDELVDLLLRWDKDYGEEYPDVMPFATDSNRETMFRLALSLYKDAMAAQGQPFSYQDASLLRMLERAMALDAPQNSTHSISRADAACAATALFRTESWFDMDSLNEALDDGYDNEFATGAERWLPLPLTMSAGDTPCSTTTLTLMFVNPKSPNKDLAIRFIEAYIDNMDLPMRMMMNPRSNAPIVNPQYAQELAQMQAHLSAMETALQSAEGADKTQLEQKLQNTRQQYQARSQRMQYLLPSQPIALYRQLMENHYIDRVGYYVGLLGGDVNALIRRTLDGQISVAQFAQEAEGKLRLMRLESQP
ncbi:MAG: extracellular solute-binding protein [Christensenellales bacterium]|jgi:hypothetical protein